LTGAERGTLAEALLAVATPSGPERVIQVLDWLLAPVKSRWYSVETGAVLPLVANLTTPEAFMAQEQQQQQLSNVHWDLFHDVQLLERCMRRCLPGSSAQAAQKVVQEAPGEQQQQQQQSVCLILEHVEWAILLATEMHRLVRQIYTPGLQSQMVSSNLAESLQPSWEEYAASLKPGKLKEFALEQAENQNATQLKVVSVRDWLRVLRDASLNIINLVLLHASEMTYSNPSIAGKMQTVIATDLEAQRDDQVRTMVLLFVRPVLSRCPAQFRQIWFQALVAPILPDLCRRVEAGWTIAGANKATLSTPGTTTNEALDTSSDVSTYATLVAEAYSERTLREISRELGSILELIVAPDGTLGRRTKSASTSDTEKDAVAGGKHLIDWMCSQSDVQVAQIAIQAGTLALKIDDLETVSKAILFCRGLVAAASAQDPRIGEGLAESCGGEIVLAAVAALSKSLNSSLQAELLSLIYEVLTKHARTTQSVPHAMLCIPGITESVLMNTLEEMSKCRSEKKATGLVKNLLLSIPGEELKILATGDNKKTISAIQIPTNSKRRQSDGGNASEPVKSSWTENEVHAGFQLFQ
jgi:exportin-5